MAGLIALFLGPTALPAQGPVIGGCPVLPRDNIWNVRVDSLPVHPDSELWIQTIGSGLGLKPDFGSGGMATGLQIPPSASLSPPSPAPSPWCR